MRLISKLKISAYIVICCLMITFVWSLAGPAAFNPSHAYAAEEAKKNDNAKIAYETARRSLNLQTEHPASRKLPEPPIKIRKSGIQFPDGLAKFILIVAGAVVLFIVASAVRDYLKGRTPDLKAPKLQKETDKEQAEVSSRMTQARDSADELAKNGDFTQAMHVLLLQSVSELRRRLEVSIASCLTSREILARMKMSPEAKRAFADIISRVEISYFGRHQPNLEDYLACRGSFEKLKDNIKVRATA